MSHKEHDWCVRTDAETTDARLVEGAFEAASAAVLRVLIEVDAHAVTRREARRTLRGGWRSVVGYVRRLSW